MAGRHRMFDADSAPQWDNTAQAQIAALRGEPLGWETLESFRQKAARDGGWSLGLKSSRLVYRYCFGARVWRNPRTPQQGDQAAWKARGGGTKQPGMSP